MRSVECRVQNASWCGAEGPEEANNVRQGSTALASISGAACTTPVVYSMVNSALVRLWVACHAGVGSAGRGQR